MTTTTVRKSPFKKVLANPLGLAAVIYIGALLLLALFFYSGRR